ncbi:transcription elongation factor, mitochondrial isoform X2 [Symphalangus syndactylus]|uniref:transcription elongation factor, mitochondrial isoform X2 n=1 Tax=Symphalangus syndactylus TaxID=9590 RepID=UPI0030072C12
MSGSVLFVAGERWRCFLAPSRSSLFWALHNFCCRKKSTTPKKITPSVTFCDENAKEPENALDKLFSSEQQASILHVLNTASTKELEAFRLLRGRRIAWAHLDRKLTVLDWQQSDRWSLMRGISYSSSVYLEEISSIISKMPKADFYVLEKTGLSIQNSSLFPILLHFHIMEAMLYALLNKTFAQDGQHQVLSMNRNAVGKHFELMIGDSRTSGKELVKQFLSDSVLKADPRVFFPSNKLVHYRQMFVSTELQRVEELYDSLLQAIAFYELAVFDSEP